VESLTTLKEHLSLFELKIGKKKPLNLKNWEEFNFSESTKFGKQCLFGKKQREQMP